MKKQKLNHLKLSKQRISVLQKTQATGGKDDTVYFTCYPVTQCYYTPME